VAPAIAAAMQTTPADHQGQDLIVWRGPSGHKEDGARSHQRGDAHAADGIEELPSRPLMRAATVTKRKPNTVTKMPANKFCHHSVFRALHGVEREQYPKHGDDERGTDDDQRMGTSRSMPRATVGLPGAFSAGIF